MTETIYVVRKLYSESENTNVTSFADLEKARTYVDQKNELHKFSQYPRYYIDPLPFIKD